MLSYAIAVIGSRQSNCATASPNQVVNDDEQAGWIKVDEVRS